MASLVSACQYLTFDAVTMTGYTIQIDLSTDVNEVDVSRGNVTHEQKAAGLRSSKLKIDISMDDTTLSTYIGKLTPGVIVDVVIGPQGNTVGKPKHRQSFMVKSAPLKMQTAKDNVVFSIEMTGADAPVNDFFTGATF